MGGIRHTTARYQSLIENTYKKGKICLRIKMKLEKSNHQEGIFTSWKNSASLIFALTNFQMFFHKKNFQMVSWTRCCRKHCKETNIQVNPNRKKHESISNINSTKM